MPHDRNGKLLSNDDEVTVRGRVDLISSNPDRCNLRLMVDDPADPLGYKFVYVDSCLVELVAADARVKMPADEPALEGGDVVAPPAEELATSA